VHESTAWFLTNNPHLFSGAKIEDLSIVDVYQSYNVMPKAVLSGSLLLNARPAPKRWMYFIMRGTNAFAIAELKANDDNSLELVELDRGLALALRAALIKSEQLPQVKKQDYDFCFLNLSPLSFWAIWLHGKADDIIIPLSPDYGLWNANQSYSEKEIIRILKPIAEDRMKAPRGTVD